MLRLGLGLRLIWQTCPQVGLVSAFCSYPPTFASDFLHPQPRGCKLVFYSRVPPNRPLGDFHSRPSVMSSVPKKDPLAPSQKVLIRHKKAHRLSMRNCHLKKSKQTSVKNNSYKSPTKFLQNCRRLYKANNLRPAATRGTFAALRCLFLLPTRKQ